MDSIRLSGPVIPPFACRASNRYKNAFVPRRLFSGALQVRGCRGKADSRESSEKKGSHSITVNIILSPAIPQILSSNEVVSRTSHSGYSTRIRSVWAIQGHLGRAYFERFFFSKVNTKDLVMQKFLHLQMNLIDRAN